MRAFPTGCVLALSVSMSGCGERPPAKGVTPEWTIAAAPRLAIGDRVDTDTVVFSTVTDARLLPGGALVVADGGAWGVRTFDASGALVSSAGTRGRGPGEFSGGISLAGATGDSVAVWDPGQSRWTLVHVLDGGTRTITGASARPVWFHAGVMVQSALAAPPAWVPPLLRALSTASPEVRLAHLDRTGLLYVRQDPAVKRWLVYNDSAAAVGALTLPDGVTAFQFTGDAVVGLRSDSLGLQQVVVHDIRTGEHAAPDLTPAETDTIDAASRSRLMAALRYAVTAQEMHWVTAQSYTAAADSLAVTMPEGARFKVIEATKGGWRGVGWFPASGYSCGMVVGLSTPAGWSEGAVACGR